MKLLQLRRCTPATLAACLMVCSDWSKVYPGALRLTEHQFCAVMAVAGLTIRYPGLFP